MPAKVRVELLGRDGNAHAILARWDRAAKRQGWTDAERAEVLADAQSADYAHLLRVVNDNSEDLGFQDSDFDS